MYEGIDNMEEEYIDKIHYHTYDNITKWIENILINDEYKKIYYTDICTLLINRTTIIFGNIEENIELNSYEEQLDKLDSE